MTPERWQHVKEVLATALELPPAERTAYLDRGYAEDASLRDDIEPLLASEQRLNAQFLDQANLAAAAATLISPDRELLGGTPSGAVPGRRANRDGRNGRSVSSLSGR